MIKIKLRRFDKVVEIRLPTERESVMVSLWRLGLNRDPGKYILRELNAFIFYNMRMSRRLKAVHSHTIMSRELW